MSMKLVLVAAASVMAVSPALAMSRSQIVNHTGGPIPYSQLVSMDKSGYNTRTHKKTKKAASSDQSVAANGASDTAATLGDQNAAPPAPTASPAPAAPDALASPPPASPPPSAAAPSASAPTAVNPPSSPSSPSSSPSAAPPSAAQQ
jgi:hypothetical protein